MFSAITQIQLESMTFDELTAMQTQIINDLNILIEKVIKKAINIVIIEKNHYIR